LNKAVFLDRDGTIIKDEGYLRDPDSVCFLQGAIEALKDLMTAGYMLVLVSNQSGVGRGYFSEDSVMKVHERIKEILAREGVVLDGIYYCPHAPEEACECRKPSPGMILRAAKELKIDLSKSVMIGDKQSDLDAGSAAGCGCSLILKNDCVRSEEHGRLVFGSLSEAVRFILSDDRKKSKSRK